MASNDAYASTDADNIRHTLPQYLQERCSAVFREGVGRDASWWLWLDYGWSSEMDPGGCHTDHETTKAEIMTRLRNAVPCQCEECVMELAARKAGQRHSITN